MIDPAPAVLGRFAGKLAAPMGWRRSTCWLGLLALAFCVQRLRTYDEPFQRDIMTYAVIGHELVLGNRLYSDVLDHKPPAVYATFSLAERLVGYGDAEVYLVNVLFSVLAMAGLFLSAARGAGAGGGLLAALLWLVFSYDLNIHGNQPQTEACLNACLAVAFGVLFASGRAGRAWIAGLLLALASLYKPLALVMLPLWGATVFLQAAYERRYREAVHRLAALCVPSTVVWAAVLGYFWFDDRLEIFLTAVISFNRDYAGNLGANLERGLSPARLWPGALRTQLPLLLLSVVGVVLGLVRDRWAVLPLMAYAAGAVVMVALPGRWWPHYYQIYVPPLVLGATLGLAQVGRLRAPWASRAGAVLLAAVVGVGLSTHLGQLALDGDAASLRKHSRFFIAVRDTASRAAALLRPHETVFVYGIDPGIYFHTRRRPIAQALWINHLVGPLRLPLRQTLRRQLREVRPDLLVVDTRYRFSYIPEGLALWIEEEYERLPATPEIFPFQLAVRRDSALHARAFAGGPISRAAWPAPP